MLNEKLFFSLLQNISPPEATDDKTVILWIASLSLGAVVVLAGILLKALQSHPKEIARISEMHQAHIQSINDKNDNIIQGLNDEMRKVQKEASDSFYEYSRMLHQAVSEVSKVHPDLKGLFDQLEKNIKIETDRIREKLQELISQS